MPPPTFIPPYERSELELKDEQAKALVYSISYAASILTSYLN